MNQLQLMELHKSQFTPNDLLIYETIIKNPNRIIHLTTSTLAEELIIFSVSAKPYIMQDAARTNGKIMLITANPNHGYQDAVDKTVVLPYIPPDPETSSVSPVLFDIFVELLVSYMSQEQVPEIQ